MELKKLLKLATIAGASEALKYRRNKPNAQEDEILQHVSRESNKIAETLMEED